MYKRLALITLASFSFGAQAADDTGGISLTVGGWDYQTDGIVRDDDSSIFSPQSNLRLDDGEDAFYELTLRAPGGFAPVFSIRYINMDLEGTSDTTLAAGPLPLPAGGAVTHDVETDLDDLELATYYHFSLPAGFGVDLGAAVKRVNGEVIARDTNTGQEADRRDVDIVFPVLLAAVSYQPRDWISGRLSARGISSDDDSVGEYRAELGIKLQPWLTLVGGYWRKDYDVHEHDLHVDLTLDGPFLGFRAGL